MAVTRSIHLQTDVPGPRSQAILARKEAAIAAPLQPAFPIVVASASGATMTDVDGNTYLDFTGGVGCMNVGYSQPAIVAAAREQLERFFHTDFTIVPYEPTSSSPSACSRGRRSRARRRRPSSTPAPRRSRMQSSSPARTRSGRR